MAVANDTTQLISAVRRDTFLAASDDNWTSDRILGIADDCTLSYCAPALKRAKQGWFQDDFTFSLVSGVTEYDVPEEAMWTGIESAWLVNKTSGLYYAELDVVASSNRMMYQTANNTNGSVPTSIYLNQTQIVFLPAPSASAASTYNVVVSAYRRPAQLCLPSVTCQIVSLNSVTQTITTTTQPSTWSTLAPDIFTSGSPYRLDFYNRLLPNTRKFWNQTLTSPSVTALTFSPTITAANFAMLSAGDYVTLKGVSPFPDMPPEAVPFLRKMISKTITTAQTDSEALSVYLNQKSDELETLMKGMSNRSDGSPHKLSLYNSAARSFVRLGTYYRR